jgi:hypothetical protein
MEVNIFLFMIYEYINLVLNYYLLQRFLSPCFLAFHVDNRRHCNHYDDHDTCTTNCYVEGTARCH